MTFVNISILLTLFFLQNSPRLFQISFFRNFLFSVFCIIFSCHFSLTLYLPRGWLPPPDNFSLSPQKKKKSDLSHIGDRSNIFRGNFDEKKNEGTTLPGASVSRQRRVGRRWLLPKKIQNFEKVCLYGLETFCV